MFLRMGKADPIIEKTNVTTEINLRPATVAPLRFLVSLMTDAPLNPMGIAHTTILSCLGGDCSGSQEENKKKKANDTDNN